MGSVYAPQDFINRNEEKTANENVVILEGQGRLREKLTLRGQSMLKRGARCRLGCAPAAHRIRKEEEGERN